MGVRYLEWHRDGTERRLHRHITVRKNGTDLNTIVQNLSDAVPFATDDDLSVMITAAAQAELVVTVGRF